MEGFQLLHRKRAYLGTRTSQIFARVRECFDPAPEELSHLSPFIVLQYSSESSVHVPASALNLPLQKSPPNTKALFVRPSRRPGPPHPSKEGTRRQKAVIGVCLLEPNHAKHKTVTMRFDQLLSYSRMTCSRSFVKQRVATIHHPSKVPFFQEHHQVMRKPKSAA